VVTVVALAVITAIVSVATQVVPLLALVLAGAAGTILPAPAMVAVGERVIMVVQVAPAAVAPARDPELAGLLTPILG
jgi:hypothetical protein